VKVEREINEEFYLNIIEFCFIGTASSQNRAVLIDWLYQVHDRFKLLSDTFHMTINFIDRYLQLVDASKHELQLIGSAGTNKMKCFDNRKKSLINIFVFFLEEIL
jgi:hypothetical protein